MSVLLQMSLLILTFLAVLALTPATVLAQENASTFAVEIPPTAVYAALTSVAPASVTTVSQITAQVETIVEQAPIWALGVAAAMTALLLFLVTRSFINILRRRKVVRWQRTVAPTFQAASVLAAQLDENLAIWRGDSLQHGTANPEDLLAEVWENVVTQVGPTHSALKQNSAEAPLLVASHAAASVAAALLATRHAVDAVAEARAEFLEVCVTETAGATSPADNTELSNAMQTTLQRTRRVSTSLQLTRATLTSTLSSLQATLASR